jgi:hypothetical protein
MAMQSNHWKIKSYIVLVTILMILFCIDMARGQTDELRKSFSQAQREPNLRNSFIESYVQREGLPDHVIEMLYSSEIKVFAVTNPLVKTEIRTGHLEDANGPSQLAKDLGAIQKGPGSLPAKVVG